MQEKRPCKTSKHNISYSRSRYTKASDYFSALDPTGLTCTKTLIFLENQNDNICYDLVQRCGVERSTVDMGLSHVWATLPLLTGAGDNFSTGCICLDFSLLCIWSWLTLPLLTSAGGKFPNSQQLKRAFHLSGTTLNFLNRKS